MADDKKIIFSMVGVSKTYPPQKQVLKNIYLSFFYGAKIGIIGLNGAPSYSVGYLEQEPHLEPGKTVIEVVREGVKPVMDLLAEFEKVNEAFGDPDVLENPDRMDALIARQAELQDALDAADAWNIDNRLERAICAACCCSNPTCCCSTSQPTTSTPKASTGSSSTCASIPAPL